MDYQAIVKQLNQLSIDFGVDKKISFYANNEIDVIGLLNKICPCGEVALFHSEQSFLTYFDLIEGLKKGGFKYQSFVEEDYPCSFNNVGNYLNLSEDVRCVVCFTSKAYSLCSYLATLRGVEVIYLVDSMDLLDLLNTRIQVFNTDGFDYIEVDNKARIIFDFESINATRDKQATVFGYLLSLTTALIDYRIGGLAGVNGLDGKSFNMVKQSVLRSYLVYSKPYEEQAIYLLKNFFKCKIANLSVKGEILDFSAPVLSSLLYGSKEIIANPNLVERILNAYSIICDYKENNYLSLRNYFLDLTSLKNLTGEEVDVLYSNIKNKTNLYEVNKGALLTLLTKLKEEIKLLLKSVSSIKNTFFALGGKDDAKMQKLIDSIMISGCLYNAFNGMTLVKESGIID